MLVCIYNCQNATLMEITFYGSFVMSAQKNHLIDETYSAPTHGKDIK